MDLERLDFSRVSSLKILCVFGFAHLCPLRGMIPLRPSFWWFPLEDAFSIFHLNQWVFCGKPLWVVLVMTFVSLSLRIVSLYRFSVSSKMVGFHIYNIIIIDRPEFRASFRLWNFGGPNWVSEFRNYLKEESSWKFIWGKKSISYADAVRSPSLSGANALPVLRKNFSKLRCEDDALTSGRTSIFNTLSSYSSSCRFGSSSFRNSFVPAKNKAFSLGLAANRPSSLAPFKSGYNGRLYSRVIHRGRHGHPEYCNSNLNLRRLHKLQWRPKWVGLFDKPNGHSSSEGPAAADGSGSIHFFCQFCQDRGHLELFCQLKKQRFIGRIYLSFLASKTLEVGFVLYLCLWQVDTLVQLLRRFHQGFVKKL